MTKTILAKTAVATVIMLCFALTSCEPDRHWRYSERDLYGKWYSTSTDGYYLTTITMYSDGLGYIEDWEGDYLVTRDRFEWEADRRYIYVYYYDYGIEEPTGATYTYIIMTTALKRGGATGWEATTC